MSKEHAYAYEAGYRDGSTNYELEHCPACNNVANLQDALDENTKLRQELEIRKASEQEKTIEYLRQENIDWEDKYRVLADGNVKLQELVDLLSVINKHMSLCATTDCGQCPVKEECEKSVYLEGLLGIDSKDLSWRVQERMAGSTDHKQNDLLKEYGTATTAYLLMAMSIDSLERKNKQLEEENTRLMCLLMTSTS